MTLQPLPQESLGPLKNVNGVSSTASLQIRTRRRGGNLSSMDIVNNRANGGSSESLTQVTLVVTTR